MNKNYFKLCFVTDAHNKSISEYKKIIFQAIAGGITLVQLREKTKNPKELLQFALTLKTLLAPFKIPLIINDHVELAKEINADGVHLGQSDGSVLNARALLGPKKIIGLSIESLEELEIANSLPVEYIAASAVFPSTSKKDCKKIWGLEGLAHITQKSKHPVMAIGGINHTNVREVIHRGADGIAVISAIQAASYPKHAARQLIHLINEAKNV